MKTLVIGYGNPCRNDDGIGIRIAEQIERARWDDVVVNTVQQLHVELAEDCTEYERVIFIDSSAEGPEVSLKKLEPQKEVGVNSSHHLRVELLVTLANLLHSRLPEFYLCTVRSENFDFGETISEKVLERSAKAFEQLKRLIESGKVFRA